MSHGRARTAARSLWTWRCALVLIASAYALGVVGFLQYEDLHHRESGATLNALYHPLQLFILHTAHLEAPIPVTLEVARFLAPAAFGLTALLGFSLALWREVRRVRFSRAKGHVVICGLGEKGLELVKCHRERSDRVVVIEKDPDNPFVRAAETEGALVLFGDMTERRMLEAARVGRAAIVVAVSGEESENVETALGVLELVDDLPLKVDRDLHCFVHLSNLHLRNAFEVAGKRFRKRSCEVHFFDSYEYGAEEQLRTWPLHDDVFASDGARRPCLIIMGFGRMGRAIALETVASQTNRSGPLLRAHVFDRKADLKRQQLEARYPDLASQWEFEFHEVEADSKEAMQKVEEICRDPKLFVTVVFSCDRDGLNLELALRLLPVLRRTGSRAAVRLVSKHGLAHLIEEPSKHLRVFGKHRDSLRHEAYISIVEQATSRRRIREGRSSRSNVREPGEPSPDGDTDDRESEPDPSVARPETSL